jgi:hypothetical protein
MDSCAEKETFLFQTFAMSDYVTLGIITYRGVLILFRRAGKDGVPNFKTTVLE